MQVRGCSDTIKPESSPLNPSSCNSDSVQIKVLVLFTGSAGPSPAGVFSVCRGDAAVRPGSGRWDFPHGADTLLVSGFSVGCQLPHGCTPPGSRAHFRLPEDPATTQH